MGGRFAKPTCPKSARPRGPEGKYPPALCGVQGRHRGTTLLEQGLHRPGVLMPVWSSVPQDLQPVLSNFAVRIVTGGGWPGIMDLAIIHQHRLWFPKLYGFYLNISVRSSQFLSIQLQPQFYFHFRHQLTSLSTPRERLMKNSHSLVEIKHYLIPNFLHCFAVWYLSSQAGIHLLFSSKFLGDEYKRVRTLFQSVC